VGVGFGWEQLIWRDLVDQTISGTSFVMRPVSKRYYYLLEGMNSFATSYYFFYLFFYMTARFQYGNLGNLGLSAGNGFLYMFAAYFAGSYGQRRGYHRALRIGFGTMAVMMGVGAMVETEVGQLVVMGLWTLGMCFTWPTLEALVSEGETPRGLQRSLGIYNLVWAGASTCSYFAGGTLIQILGLKSMFVIPAVIHTSQCIVLWGIERGYWGRVEKPAGVDHVPVMLGGVFELTARPIARTRAFLRMSWIANPFAYVALNTVGAIMPSIVSRLQVSPAAVGGFCAIWFFARMVAFFILWRWSGWHYRRGWFYGAYGAMLFSFVGVCAADSIWVAVVSQSVFGLSIGLIYYSSLYYSMDAGDSKGEHGGMHEAAIGCGICFGPAVGALGVYLFPGVPQSVTWAVGGLLGAGLLAVVAGGWSLFGVRGR